MKFSPRGWTLGASALIAALYLHSPLLAESPHDASEGGDWAFHALKRPLPPAVARPGGTQNAIDAFVHNKLEAKGLTLNRPADRLTILKRLTYDLTGLAPTPEERDAFLNDGSPDAYDKVVERLLASPHFGERSAQHWLDLVRYSETDGFKLDRYRPNAWRYRDYVIRSFNADLPYDRFMRQQVAGDELEPENPDAVLATGFLRLHPEETNGANYRQIRQDILDDVTEVAGLAFLGLTIGCARCHDHKFDPISQDDYFEMQAFFAGMMPRDSAPLLRGREEKEYRAKMAAWETATESIRKEMDSMLVPVHKLVFEESVVGLDEETQKALKTPEAERTSMQMQLAVLGVKQIARKYDLMYRRLNSDQQTRFLELKSKLATFDAMKPDMPMAMAVMDAGPNPPPTYRLGGGDYRRPKREVRPDFLDCIHAKNPVIAPPRSNPKSSGRRSAFANWLSEPEHPLTSRVIVNRLWQQYFGKGIVATPSDFGAAGQRPTHSELLDFLATELIARDWSLKAIHRLIVTSATYRQDSAPERNSLASAAAKIDPENKLLWHARVRRRDAESIRDLALEASGLLNCRMFDPSACPELPTSILSTSRAWYADEKVVDRNRRSIYVFNRRNLTYPLFAAFDSPNRSLSCPTRTATVTAPQALLMLNGEFSIQQARALAVRLTAQSSAVREIIRQGYNRILCREASADDIARAEAFLRQQSERIGRDVAESPEGFPKEIQPALAAAIVDFCHALLNSAEFLNVE